jgi:hypothetical protein
MNSSTIIEVFKTNVPDKLIAQSISEELLILLPNSKVNFDLEDCDRILRVESEKIIPTEVTEILSSKGFLCEVLE